MSPTQQGILFQARHGEKAGLYHVQAVFEIAQDLDLDAFRRSWQHVAERHAVLRTGIVDRAGEEPLQTVREEVEVPLVHEDWSSLEEAQLAERLRDRLRHDLEQGFDLTRAPLWRLHVARLGPARYEVLWSLHYLLMDGRSQAAVVREVERTYASLVSGASPDLPAVPPFGEYIDWLGRQDADGAETFWREELRSVSPAGPLPVERRLPAGGEPAGDVPAVAAYAQVPLALDGAETAALRAAGQRHGLSLGTLVRGAWAFLLSRYQGTDEVVVGATTPGRPAGLPGAGDMVGLFINTLPLRVRVPASEGWAEWMRGLQRQYEQIRAHEHSPLLRIQQWSGIGSGESLFTSVVLVEDDPGDDSRDDCGNTRGTGETATRSRPFRMVRVREESHAAYPLSLVATPGERLTLTVHYDTRRFEAATAERAADHLRRILAELVDRPDARLGQLNLLAPEEFSRLVHTWNDTDTPYSQDLCIHQLFERRAAEAPDAPALLFRDERWTYREVNERANQVAHHLRHLGIGRGDQVAILTERSAEMIPALLGVLKAGAAYVPLDPGAPVRRWHWITGSLKATCVLTQHAFVDRLLSAGPLPDLAHILCLDPPGDGDGDGDVFPAGGPCAVHSRAGTDAMPTDDLPRQGTPQDLAYTIFTSGSTGTPKGVAVAHFPAVNLIEWVNNTFAVGPDDRVLFVTALTFDLSVYDVFGILAAGGSIRVASDEDIREPANLLRHLADEPITFWDSAPAALMQLVPLLPTDGDGAHRVVSRSLRLIFMSGDWIPVHSPDLMRTVFPEVQVVGLGGATEATVWSNFFPIGTVDPAWPSIPYGRPIQNARYYVLDESMRPCPVDVPGDLYIGGLCLSSGYANEPALTASKYLPSPFAGTPGERLYKTGDMARWRPDGNLEFLGRTDSQVKIRGYRIELGEIDSTLSEHPAVQDAATIVREDRAGDRSLVSYVVLHPQRARAAVQEDGDRDGDKDGDSLAGRRIDRWREVYDAFDPGAAEDSEDGNDFSGWNSSYTGLPIPLEEMRSWQQDTVELIRGHDPRTILEIGCGTGLLLFPLAPGCRRYYGTDFSASALDAVRRRLENHPELRDTVVLHRAEADALDGLDPEPVDTVVINSVIQYFPGIDYLLRVVEGALSRVADGGRIVIGDVRSLPLLDAFHASVEAERAPGATTRGQLWERVRERVQQEEELTLDPAFFRDWAARTGRIHRVEIRPSGGRHRNEMSMFRYQVVLHVGDPARNAAARPAPEGTELHWTAEGLTLPGLRKLLAGDRPARLRLRGVPNARVEEAVRTLRWLTADSGSGPETAEDWRARDRAAEGVDPEDIRDLAGQAGYRAALDWSRHGADGRFDALLTREGTEPEPDEEESVSPAAPEQEAPDWSEYANQPLKAEIRHLLLPRLHTHLAERLPGYMLPSDLVALDTLPVTSSGKLDRRALPAPQASGSDGSAPRVPARNTTEALLVSMWEQILDRSPIGVLDNFFELGGHSLLAVQLVARIRQVFSLDVPVRLFFDLPTIAEVARELQRRQEELQPRQGPPLTPVPRGRPLPATFDQQRLWFIDRLSPGTTSYTVNWLIPLPAAIGTPVVRDALAEMTRRHETLRTTFREEDGRVWQIVADAGPVGLPVSDLSGLPAEQSEQRARDEIRQWWDQPFDLVRGPLLRARLIKLPDAEQVIALSAHHMVFDGYSIGLFGREFVEICRALADGEPSPLPDPDIQYADYAAWQHSRLEEDGLQFHLDYWKEQLTGAPELLTLPTDFPRPDEQSLKGDFLRRQLSPESTRHVAQLSREYQVTHYITLLSCYAVFLSRYSGQDVVVIGVPIANRNRVELESMIGFLVSTVALRVDLSDNPSFEDVLLQVRKQLFDAQSHQDVPFERLVEALAPTRSLGYNPVFQAMFADESLPLLDHVADLVRPKPWMHELIAQGMSVGVARFDLTLMIQAAPEGTHFGFEYSTDLFREPTVARMADHFAALLDSALADPGQRVRHLPMTGETERRQLVDTGHGTRGGRTSAPAPLTELFAERVRRCPDRVAVVSGDAQVSYAALDRWSNRLARLLRERGVGRESAVGLCVPRSVEMVVGVLGIVKAGGAYVPLDPAYPRERLAFMVEDAGLSLVLAEESVRGVLPESGAPVLAVGEVWAELERWSGEPVEPAGGCDDLAYVMYTSGSTGRPKGVAVTHADVAALASDSRFARGHERVLLHSPQAFDASTYEFWVPLLSGGRMVIAPEGSVTPEVLRDTVATHSVSALWLTAALFHLFAQEDPGCLSGLGEVWTGGDAVRAEAVRRVRAACPDLTVVDGYGPTETTTFATSHRIEPGAEVPATVPIGRPLDDMQVFVLDGLLQPVPAGVTGELHIGGAGLARGYLGRPDLTAEAFVANPHGAPGSRLYRTGDLARLLPDGNVDVLGRVDDQVKIRGFRVEPGEIEDALTGHPGVRGAAVLVHRQGDSKRLVAYVVFRDGVVAGEELRSFLGERLPAYMVPGVFVPLEVLPLSPNGKVDRRALAGLPWEEYAGAEREFTAPRTEVEEQLALIWREVLGTGRPVGVHDDFFSLGGDSILSLQVIFRARQVGLHFTVKQLFRYQTVAALAPVVERQEAPRVRAEQGPVSGPVELTPIQRWFFAQDFVRPGHVNQSVLVEVDAGVAAGSWERVVRRLLEHHDGLRARFFREDGVWRSELAAAVESVPWRVHDLSSYPAGERRQRLTEEAGRVQASMDLAGGPLFRAVLFTGLEDGTHRLLLVAHHLVIDVVSWRILLEDLQTLLEQARQEQELVLPAKSSSWREWAARLAEEALGAETAGEVAYWSEQCAGPVAELPLDGPVDGNTVGAGRVVEAVLGAEETGALLREVPAVFGTRVNDVLLTGVASAVGAWARGGHVRVDVEGHGREDLFGDVDVSRTTGWFTTVSPLRLPVPAPDAPGEGLKRIKELLRGRPRQGIGYGLLAHGPEDTALGGAPGAQLSFNHLGQFDGSFAGSFAASLGEAGPDWAPENRRPYLIDIVSSVQDGELRMQWTYNGTAHREETIRRVAERTLETLRQLVREARRPGAVGYTPSDLPLSGLSQEGVDELVDDLRAQPAWRESRSPRPLEDCYPQTPVQQGLWFQSQFAGSEGVYHVQLILGIDQELDAGAFRRGWAEVMRRHPILRTSFRAAVEGGGDGLQLVWSDLPVPLREEDWRSRGADEQRELLEEYLRQDRVRGFEPQDAPQWRMFLARLADDRYELVWSAHHAILDGWSISLILNDAVQWYGVFADGRPREESPTRPYRDYVSWLGEQDLRRAEDYWRDTLHGVDQATPLDIERHADPHAPSPEQSGQAETDVFFDAEDTARLQKLAQDNRLTLNTVLQGCWALLLGRYTSRDDVVFGTVVSGRPSEIEGIERTVGLFINTLPLRVRLPQDSTVLAWLRELQEQNLRMRQYEYSPLGAVQQWSGLPVGAPLFESLFVFENYPVEKDDTAALRLDLTRSEERINYPLGIVATVPDARLRILVQYDTGRFEQQAIERTLGHLRNVCSHIARDPGARLGEITVLTDEERRQILQQGSSAAGQTPADEDFDLSDFAAGIATDEERELLEQLLAEVQGTSPPGDLQSRIPSARPATETSENHE
ncbi:amino acid adenylation domain-containing protein [Streptomyces sp. F63]|uniref:non-ribosomal peptide synthetase n=1 Tax=Streptomyces sp. F63 TaxID=2824887 RepID=UPI001B36DE0F|nr:non-ribosomal peptide synthetase [Streptomyces sp. F63]MBQ0985577.1 amino acid adenylation domain-containing protein [Streptomyces sp. F63]